MPQVLVRKITAGYAVALGCLLVIGGAAWWSVARFRDTFQWVDHTHLVLYQLESTYTRLLVLQSNSRGFALTANETLLRSYDADETALRECVAGLRGLIRDNPGQLEQLARLEPLITRAIDLQRERIETRRKSGLAAVAQSRPNATGVPIMESVRQIISAMEAEERSLLAQRSTEAQVQARLAMGIFLGGGIAALTLVTVAGLTVRRDFRQRMRAEAERDRFFSLSLDLLCIADAKDGRFKRVSPGVTEILGWTPEEFLARPYMQQIHPDDRPAAEREVERQVVRGEKVQHFETRFQHKDGSWRLLSWRSVPQPDGLLYATARDVTQLRATEAMIRRQNRQLNAIFESLPGLCLVLTPDLHIVTATDAYLAATMTEREKIRGRHLFEVFPDNPADPTADGVRNLRVSLDRVAETRAADTMAIQRYDVRHPDGTFEERFWSPINSPVFGADGQMEYIIHRVEDVTAFVRARATAAMPDLPTRLERMQAEAYQSAQQVQAAKRQLEAANKELEAFSYSVSHDLRAPLRHIDGFAGMIRKNSAAALDDQGRRHLEVISASARQMGRLIDDLLNFSRMGRTPLQPVEVDQDALVAAVIRDGGFERGGRTIRWEIAPLPRVRADHTLLRQVWANLLENAVKYTGRKPEAVITIGSQPDPDTCEQVFFVRDNGAGFDMRYADKLFGVFQRLHGPTEFEGTGIGLANVRRIITRHGGRTWAEGAVDAGATLYFSLPLTPAVA